MKRHKTKGQRNLAVFLCFCILFTLPGISDAFPVAAAGQEESTKADNIITNFIPLSEEVKEQTVSVGTDLEALNLPDELTVYLECKQKTEDQKAEESEQEDTESEHTDETVDSIEETEDIDNEEGQETEPADTAPEEDITSEKTDVQEKVTEDTANMESDGDMDEESISVDEQEDELTQETHTVTIPEYQTENVISVETLENMRDTEPEKTAVTINGVIWQSEPEYDSNTEGTYVFTVVLPDGYEVAESVNLPQITVTVQTEYKASTAAGEMLKKILDKYFNGSEGAIYETILAMDEDTRLSLTADYEELLAAMTEEDETDEKLQSVLAGIRCGIGDAAAKIPMRAPVFFRMSAAASAASGSIPLRRISGAGNAFVYHSFNETKSFTAGNTYAFLNGVYGYEDAVSSLGSGAILKAVSEKNNSLTYIRRKYGDSATVKVYVDVITKGRDFDHCEHGGLYQVPDSGTPTEYRYFCWASGAQNCGPYYAYTYVKESLSYADVSASLNNIEKQGSTDSKDYTVKVTFGGDRSMMLDAGSYTVQIPNPNSDEVNIIVSDSEGNQINTEFQMPLVVNYDGNGAGVSNVPGIQAAWKGENFTIAGAPVRSGYRFINWKEAQTGTVYAKGQRIASFGSKSLLLKAQWEDIQAPEVGYTPTQVMTRATDAEVKAAVEAALTITDNEPAEECTVEITVPSNCAMTAGNKEVTVKVTDKAGNATNKTCTVNVMSYVEFSKPVFTADTKNLSAILRNPGTDPVTESGFVWGIMSAPSISINNGKITTASPVVKADGTISVTADNLQKGVTYYARAYIIADDVAYYSEEITIGLGLPAYGTFTIKNNNDNTFTVTRSGGSEGAQTVYYRTVNGSAAGGTHFTHQAFYLTFAAGETFKTITVDEQGANAAYSGKPATAYTNADRVYSVELYRVTGGGALGDTVRAERTMAKNSSYVVDRHIYDEQTTNGPQEEKTRGDYKDDKIGWTENVASESAKEVLSIKDNLCPASRTYWMNTAQELHYQLTFNAREEAGGYQAIQITPGTVLDTKIYPEGGALKGQRSTTYYVAQFEHGGGGSANKTYAYYTFPYTSKSERKPTNEYKESDYIKDSYVVFDVIQENMVVGYGASGDNSDLWKTTEVKHHFFIDDTREPQFVSVAPMAGGLYKTGDAFTVSLLFDEIVDSQNSGDLNSITVNTTWGQARYAGGADTNVLYFTGTITGNADTTLEVNGFTNADQIKDMCDNTSTTATASGGGSTTATVDTAKPNLSAVSQGIAGGTGTVKVVVNADQSKTDSLRYAWSDSDRMPATGWVDASAAELSSAKGAAGLSLSIRKEPGSGRSNGKWYLHVIGTYSATGAIDYQYAYVDFGTLSAPAAGSEQPSLSVSTDNSAWATQRAITIQRKGGGTLQYRKSGASAWTTVPANSGSVTVTENGYYTFRLKAADNVLTQTIQVEKIDRIRPTASIGALKESGSTQSPKAGIYMKLTLPVTFADSGSGVREVQYAWTNTQTTPLSGDWQTLNASQIQAGKAELSYTASEGKETPKYLHIQVIDKLNYTYTTKSAAYQVVSQSAVSNHTPGITLTGGPTAWTNDMVTLTWRLTNYSEKNYEVILPNGRSVRNNASSGELWAMQNGSYTVKVRDLDYGGENIATVQVSYIDTTSPAVTYSEVSGDWQKTAQTVTFSANDAQSGVGKKYYKIVTAEEYADLTADSQYPTTGLTEIPSSNSVNINQNGVCYVYYKYYDKAGDDSTGREANKTEGFIGPIRIDMTAPALNTGYETIGVPKSNGLTISLEASYGASGGNVKVNGSEITALTAEPISTDGKMNKQSEYKVMEKGIYRFQLTDGSGKTVSESLSVYEAAFELQGKTAVSSQPEYLPKLVVSGGTLVKPEDPERTGYTFQGWYTMASGGTLWNFSSNKITSDIILYAHWLDETPPVKPVLQDDVTLPAGWTNNQTTIPLKLYDGVGVTELLVSIDGEDYVEVDGFTGGAGTVEYAYPVTEEGDHTYRFKAKDAAGNTSAESDIFTVKLDTEKPVIGAIKYDNKVTTLWNWIIGKKSLIIHVPVTDGGSGVTQITYIATPKDSAGNLDSGKAATETADVKDGEAKITFNADFRGTIAITCTDAAGNSADSVTIGAEGGGVIVEDRAPDVTVQADRNLSDTQQTQPGGVEFAEGYYETAPALLVTVKDDTGNTVAAGIATVTYQVGNGTIKYVAVDKSTLQTAGQVTFTIPAAEIPTGITEIKIHAMDNAGNENTQSIIIKVKGPEKQPAAAIDYRAEEMTGLIPDGEYTINGEKITADGEGRIEIASGWFGGTVAIIKKGNGSETSDSTPQSLSILARPVAPGAPELNSRTENEITLKTISGAQYRLDDGTAGKNWQDEAFTGLEEKNVYTFRAYYPATDTSFASPESDAAKIATMPNPPTADKLSIDYGAETLALTDGIEAFSDAGCTTPVTAGSAENHIGKTVYIRYRESGTDVIIPASRTTAVTIPARAQKPSPGAENTSYPGAEDGAITGLDADTAYEYRAKDAEGNFGAWKDAALTGTQIRNLPAGGYEVRVKGSGEAGFHSEAAVVTIGANLATKYDTPDIRIDYAGRTLKGFVSGGTYIINGKEVSARQDGSIEIEAGWFDTNLSIIRKGNGKDKLNSDAQSLSVPAIPAAPTPTGVDVQTAGGTGKLTGLTAGTTYEVSTDGGGTWVTKTAEAGGVITGLAPGTYTVRVKAGNSNFAGESSEPAAIGVYKVTVTFMADGKQYDTRTVDYGGTVTDIPSVPIKDGEAGEWFADEQGGSLAVFTNITADMTVYAVYTTAYTVTLQGDGGRGTALTSYKYGTGAVLPMDWTKTGYTFDGWYDNEGCTGTAVTSITATDTGNKEFWAKWTDNIAPVIGTLQYSYQPKNFWHWLIGRDSLMITVPITEEGSGADEIIYAVTPEGGTASAKTSTIVNGEAKITVSADFKGTITITCTDKAGNTSPSVTVGKDLDGSVNGIIIEDNPPRIAFEANGSVMSGADEYETAPVITVTITDSKNDAVSAGIASVSYQIGNGSIETLDGSYTSDMVVSTSFKIQANEIPAGETVIAVTATDNAGNTFTATQTVKVHSHSGKLVPAITPTCTQAGNKAYYLCSCAKLFSDSACTVETTEADIVLEALGHDFSITDHDQIEHWKKCSRCAEEQSRENHIYDNDNDRDCNVCGYEREITEHRHSVSETVPAKAATCTEDGNKAYYICSCGKWFSDSACTNEIADHASVVIGKPGHDFSGNYQFNEKGHWKACSRCNITQTPENHVFDDENDITCNKCAYQRTIETHTHNAAETAAAKEATCTTAGNSAYYICTCGRWFSDIDCTKEVTERDVAIAAKGHDFSGAYQYDTKEHWKVCSRCSVKDTAQAHRYDNDRDADCNDCGYRRTIETPEPAPPPTTEMPEPVPQTTETPDYKPQTGPDTQDNRQPEDDKEPEGTETPEPTEQPAETEKAPEEDSGQTIPASIEGGRITVSGKPIKTGNVKDMTSTSTALELGDGAVIVTVVCEEQAYTAGVADTVAVANAVLTQEQSALVNNGETIEIRIEVTDISGSVPQQDKEVVERGIEEYRREVPGLTLGMYVDLSMFIRIGEGDWDAITTTKEPIEVIIGIPEELQETGRTYYIIRSHEGEYTFMNDMDSEQDTITISTDRFSSYAIAYVQAEGKGDKCGLCHVCPTFLGICYFIWLAVIVLTILAIWIVIRKKRREQEEQEEQA